MKIARQDSDTLVFEVTKTDQGKTLQILAVAGCLTIAGGMAYACARETWWAPLGMASKLAIGAAFAAGVFAILVALLDRFPYISCLALDRQSGRILCVRKTLRRSHSEEFEFDQIQQVTIEKFAGPAGKPWWSLRLKPDGDREIAIGIQDFPDAGKCPADALAAEIRDMLELDPDSQALQTPKVASAAEAWFTRTVACSLGAGAIAVAVMFGTDGFEAWQAQEWPQAGGTIESAQIGTELRRHGKSSVLTDVVRVVYRYSVDGVEHRGTRFNFRANAVNNEELTFVQQHCGPSQACQVFYNPSNPARSSLTTEGAWVKAMSEAVGCVVCGLIGSIAMLCSVWQIVRGKSAKDVAPAACLEPQASAV